MAAIYTTYCMATRLPYFFLLALLASSTVAAALTVSGRVLDDLGEPIAYATVYQPRTLAHDHTDELGRFSVADARPGDTLVVEALGFSESELYVPAAIDGAALEIRLSPLAMSLVQIDVTPIKDAARDVRVLDLRTRPATNSQELLRTVPGLTIGQHAGGGKAEQMFLRGFDLDHGTDISIRVDGAPVNMVSHAHGQGYADLHFVIPELIDRVDYTKGPHDARHGNFATAASVDLSTRGRLRENLVRVDGGQFGMLRGVAAVQVLDAEKHGVYVAAEGIRTDGFFESSQDFRRFNAFAKTDHRLAGGARLNLQGSHFTSEWLASGQIPQRAVDAGQIGRFGAIDDTEGGQTSRTDVQAHYRRPIGSTGMLSARAWGAHYDFELYSNFTFFLEDSENGDQIVQREERLLGGTTIRYEDVARIGGRAFEFELGVDSRFDATQDSELSRTANRTETLERFRLGDAAQQSAGAYAQAETDFGPWVASVGLRYDRTRFRYRDVLEDGISAAANAGVLQPKAALYYRPNAPWQAFAKVGTGYHANDARLITGGTAPTFLPKAHGVDIGVIAQPLNALMLSATAWGIASEQEFVYVGDAGIVEPSGRSRRIGLDLGARYQVCPTLAVGSDLTLTHARSIDEPAGADRIPLAPPVALEAFAVYQPNTGLHASARLRLLGDRAANEDGSLTAQGYQVLDLVAGYTFGNVSLDLVVDNALDADWNETQFATESRLRGETVSVEEIHFTPGTPRAGRLRVSYVW